MAAVSKPQAEALAAGKRDKDTIMVLYAPWCTFCQALEPSFSALADQLAGTSVAVAKYQVRMLVPFNYTMSSRQKRSGDCPPPNTMADSLCPPRLSG